MKMKKTRMYVEIMHVLGEFYEIKDIAKKVENMLGKIAPVEVHDIHGDGFTLRSKNSDQITDADINNAIAKGINKLWEDKHKDIEDYIVDNCDFEIDQKSINTEFVDFIFEITRNGRIISVSLDT